MALSPLRSKALHHGRSLSLPSGSHPAMSQFDENLSRVRASEAASCSSLSSMNNKINGLKSLYSSVDDLLLLPHIHQIISQESQEKWVGQMLDGYIRLLDACSSVKDLVSHTKQDVQELLSALRRKDKEGIQSYLSSRKASKKMIQKFLKNLRSFRSKDNVRSLDKDQETMSLVYMLNESESVGLAMLESLFTCMSGAKAQSNSSGWSLVSKLMQSKKESYQGTETSLNEFPKADAVLQMSQEDMKVDEFIKLLKNMESSIQNLEEELECLFRQLIKTRVFILNILNH